MRSPSEVLKKLKSGIKKEWKVAFVAALLLGLLIHFPAMMMDVPNHDGLDSMYFDQNMITSGRWFLSVACGFSSYFTIPWIIGVLSMVILAYAAVALTELLELKHTWVIVIVSGLLVSFPTLASTFAYVFTMDGYMLAVLLAVLAVLFTKKYRYGFVPGAFCLAFSLGTYQAYLAFAILLCGYQVLIVAIEPGSIKDKIKAVLCYLYMGVLGGGLYFVILQILLKIQGKELASYQGINGMAGENGVSGGLLATIKEMYIDFAAFSIKGNVVFNNVFSLLAFLILGVMLVWIVLTLAFKRKWWKNPLFSVIIGLLILALPVVTNVILVISPNVTYHLLMRYQWVLYPILILAFCERYIHESRRGNAIEWGVLLVGVILVFNYAVTDNIAYTNLQKRYEKTYSYCMRLLDRIEQTEGYYQGIPIAMIGVVGSDVFPLTDISGHVTDGMIGLNGDSLLYTGANYAAFMKHYLGATLNILSPEEMGDIYYSEEYIALDSFPGPESTKVVDGILYVKTENSNRD